MYKESWRLHVALQLLLVKVLLTPSGLRVRRGRRMHFQSAFNGTADFGFEVPSFGARYILIWADLALDY
jgi:hypothetical protein